MKTANALSVVPGQFHPLSILRMLWKHRLIIGVSSIALTIVAGSVIYQLPNLYRADAIVLVDSQKIPEKFVSSTVQVTLQDSLNSISQQVLSSGHLQAIIDELGLYQEERGKRTAQEILDSMRNSDLSINLERGFSGSRSGAFRITYEGPNRLVVAKVVNRVADLFIRENFRNREQRAEGTSEFIDAQLQEAKKSLDTQEASLSRYKMQYTGELPEQEGALMGALNRLQMEHQSNEDAIHRAQQSKVMLENTLQMAEVALVTTTRAMTPVKSRRPAAPALPDVIQAEPPRSRKASDVMRAQLEALRLRYLDDHPEVKRLKAELDRVLAEEAKVEAEQPVGPTKTETARTPPAMVEVETPLPGGPTLADLNRDRERVSVAKTQLELLDREIASRTADAKRIQESIRESQARVDKIPIREQQMASLTRDYENSKANYRSLLDKKMSAEMASDMERGEQSERFTVADPAHVPTKPVKPKRIMLCGISAVMALALNLGLFLGLELKKDSFLGEWELPSNLPILGRISRMERPAATAFKPVTQMGGTSAGLILLAGSFTAIIEALRRGSSHV
jgi:succinoglycan biosynthesis transport protein ExoP